MSLERRLASGILAEMVENSKVCTIQSDKQVEKIIDSEEHVDVRNWLWNDSVEQVDAISDSNKMVVDWSDPKRDPRVATHTTNGISATLTTNGISTQKIIDQPNHPSHCRTNYPAPHCRCGGRVREFELAPDGFPAVERHGRGAQLRAYLLDSSEGKRDRKGRRHAKGRLYLQNELHIEFAKPKFCSYLCLHSAIQGPIYCQSEAPQYYRKTGQECWAIKCLH